jgi:hypothetical protein
MLTNFKNWFILCSTSDKNNNQKKVMFNKLIKKQSYAQ